MRSRHFLVAVAVVGALALAACSSNSGKTAAPSSAPAASSHCRADECLRLNQVQVLGTHNSYHLEDPPKLLSTIAAFDKGLAESIEYTHPSRAVRST